LGFEKRVLGFDLKVLGFDLKVYNISGTPLTTPSRKTKIP
jgi:hypothetical protein